jgi:hypothetical protein
VAAMNCMFHTCCLTLPISFSLSWWFRWERSLCHRRGVVTCMASKLSLQRERERAAAHRLCLLASKEHAATSKQECLGCSVHISRLQLHPIHFSVNGWEIGFFSNHHVCPLVPAQVQIYNRLPPPRPYVFLSSVAGCLQHTCITGGRAK